MEKKPQLRTEARRRPAIGRPARPSALSGATVGLVLNAMGAAQRRLNDYLVLVHLAAGLGLMAFCVNDVLEGGPARTAIIPVLGGYLSSSVVFYAVLKDKSPSVLLWTNGLLDVVLIVVSQRLAFISSDITGPVLSMVVLVAAVCLIYGLAGVPRLSLAVGALAAGFFYLTVVVEQTASLLPGTRTILPLAGVAVAVLASLRIAHAVRRRELSRSIEMLDRIDAAILVHRLRARATARAGS